MKADTEDPETSDSYSTERLVVAVKVLLLLLALILLIVPVALLYTLNNITIGSKLGIVVGFMTLFAGSLLYTTKAKRHEVFVSAAT